MFLRPSTSQGQPCLPEAPELLSAIELLKHPQRVTLRKRWGQAGFESATSLPTAGPQVGSGALPLRHCPLLPLWQLRGLNPAQILNKSSEPTRIVFPIELEPGAQMEHPNPGPEWYTTFRGPNRGPFRGPNPGPEWNSFLGPESGPESRGPGLLAFVSTSHSLGARLVYDFSGPESGTRVEQRFGARIRARIEQLFEARLLAVHVSLGVLWRPPFQSAHLCPPAILWGPEWYTTFRGPNLGPEWNSVSGPESGPKSNNFSRPGALGCACFSGGSLEATVSICTFVSTSHSLGARMVYDFSGPESGTRMEQRFGARIRARIEQLFEARLLAVHVSLGVLWRPPFQSAHLCPPAIFSGPEWYTTFRGPNPGPEWNSVSGPESGPESNNFSRFGALGCACFSGGSLEATVSICTFVSTSHLFKAQMVSGTRMEQLFGARIGARIEQLFGARGSWLWMFLQGLFGGHRFNLHICVHQPSFRGPNGMTFLGPSPVEARTGSFFLWCLNTLCKLDFFVFWGSKA